MQSKPETATEDLGAALLRALDANPVLLGHSRRVTALAERYCEARGIAVDREVLRQAGLFHDIAVLQPFRRHPWSDTYVSHSARIARDHLRREGALSPEQIEQVCACIEHHHDLRRHADPVVEAFRHADWNEVTAGLLRRDLAPEIVAGIRRAHSPRGFYRALAGIIARFTARPRNFFRIFWPARRAAESEHP